MERFHPATADPEPSASLDSAALSAAERAILERQLPEQVRHGRLETLQDRTDAEDSVDTEEDVALLEKIQAHLKRPLSDLERKIILRPLPRREDMSLLAFRILVDLEAQRNQPALSSCAVQDRTGVYLWEERRLRLNRLMPILSMAPFMGLAMQSAGYVYYFLGALTLLLLIGLALQFDEHRLGRLVKTKLLDLNLIERVIEADPALLEIRQHVLPPWNWVFFSGSYGSIKSLTRLVAANLDWYLRPARQLLRWSWLLAGLGISALLAAIGLGTIFKGVLAGPLLLGLGLAGAGLGLLGLGHEADRRAYFLDKLIEMIRKQAVIPRQRE